MNKEKIADAAKSAHEAIDQAAAAMDGTGDVGAACDEYTEAAKSFAALILAERIKRSFDGRIDPDTGRPTES